MDEVKARHDIPQNVLLLGDIPNASALIGNCTVFSLFSKYEGLPITIIEALSAGKPVVASNVGGISELVDNSNGFLADENIDSIVNNLKTIIGNADKQKRNVRLHAKNTRRAFTLSNMWEKYHEQYLRLTIKTNETMNITIIGGAGFVGTRLTARLLAEGHSVKIADKRRSEKYPELWHRIDVRNKPDESNCFPNL